VRPGADARVVARLRRTELEQFPDGSVAAPAIRALAATTIGTARTRSATRTYTTHERIRLWPTAEPGVFAGTYSPLRPGSYYAHAITEGAQDAAAIVEVDLAGGGGDDEEAALVASATGGAIATATDLTPVVTHLRSLRRARIERTLHPMRSGWWMLPFAAALCGEWGLRRRRGQR